MSDIKVSEIVLDKDLQPRETVNSDLVQQYAEDMKRGDIFPSVNLIFDGQHYYLTSGWHRILAAKVAKKDTFQAEVKSGTRDDAVWEACGTNKEHDKAGLRRSNGDKQKAVKTALRYWTRTQNGRPLNYSEIARHCGVDKKTVSNWADKLGFSENHNNRGKSSFETVFTDDPTPERHENIFEWMQSSGQDELPNDIQDEIEAVNQELEKEKEKRATFNRTNENIEWAWWSWNPVTGCLHNCPYCYARDIANRFYPQGFEPTFHPDRLDAPENTNPIMSHIGGQNVFVCSMADLFGKWVPEEWIKSVLQAVEKNPQWTFLMLTKFPIRMAEFMYPPNVWLGTTVDKQWAVARAEKGFSHIKASGFQGICWLSCEPMMERLPFSSLEMFDWVVMGGASRSSQTPEYKPPFDDIVHLYNQAKSYGLPVYQKTNLIPGMSDDQRLREYPKRK